MPSHGMHSVQSDGRVHCKQLQLAVLTHTGLLHATQPTSAMLRRRMWWPLEGVLCWVVLHLTLGHHPSCTLSTM